MKWVALNEGLINFIGLLSEEALHFFEESIKKFEIVSTPFSIEINSYVSIQCIIIDDTAIILSFNYGKYTHLNYGESKSEKEFIYALETKYFETNSYIELSPKNKLKLKIIK